MALAVERDGRNALEASGHAQRTSHDEAAAKSTIITDDSAPERWLNMMSRRIKGEGSGSDCPSHKPVNENISAPGTVSLSFLSWFSSLFRFAHSTILNLFSQQPISRHRRWCHISRVHVPQSHEHPEALEHPPPDVSALHLPIPALSCA